MKDYIQMLSEVQFKTVIRDTPLVAVDLIVLDCNNHILLGQRINRPAQGYWFVPGSRIFKDQDINGTLQRVWRDEIGQLEILDRINMLGVYEHRYPDNFFNVPDLSTHYIVIAFLVKVDDKIKVVVDSQHKRMRFWDKSEALESKHVHSYTKNYISLVK